MKLQPMEGLSLSHRVIYLIMVSINGVGFCLEYVLPSPVIYIIYLSTYKALLAPSTDHRRPNQVSKFDLKVSLAQNPHYLSSSYSPSLLSPHNVLGPVCPLPMYPFMHLLNIISYVPFFQSTSIHQIFPGCSSSMLPVPPIHFSPFHLFIH